MKNPVTFYEEIPAILSEEKSRTSLWQIFSKNYRGTFKGNTREALNTLLEKFINQSKQDFLKKIKKIFKEFMEYFLKGISQELSKWKNS